MPGLYKPEIAVVIEKLEPIGSSSLLQAGDYM